MFGSRFGRSAGGLPAAYGPLANITALVGTVFVAPSIWPAIEAIVLGILVTQYSHQTAILLAWCMRIASFPACYYLLKAALLAAIIALTAFTTKRLM